MFDLEDISDPIEPIRDLYAPIPAPRRPVSASEPDRSLGSVATRTPPHSSEAEEALLACCLIDGSDSLQVATINGINPLSFYDSALRTIWEVMVDMSRGGVQADEIVLTEELRKRGLLDAVGGYQRVSRITDKVPTTAHRQYFIDQVRDNEILRKAITAATRQIEAAYQYQGDRTKFISTAATDFSNLAREASGATEPKPRPLMDFRWPKQDGTALIGTRRRWLCRGGALMVVGHAGTGKSVLAYQAAACWSVGKDLLGIDTVGPLRVLIIQAEDDDGDLGEIRESVVQGMNFTKEQLDTFRTNCAVIHDSINSGAMFLAALGRYIDSFKPDIVILNPLLSYVGGDLSKQEVICSFLRNGLNKINAERGNQIAYVLIHHTPKPPSGENSKAEKGHFEHQYVSFGSSDLVNAVRAVVILEPRKIDGDNTQFFLRLAKRGSRAGAKRTVKTSTGADKEEYIDKIPIQHSSRKVDVDGTQHPMVLWELSTEAHEKSAEVTKNIPRDDPRTAKKKLFASKLMALFPPLPKPGVIYAEAMRIAAERYGISKKDVTLGLLDLQDSRLITCDDNNLWNQISPPSKNERKSKSKASTKAPAGFFSEQDDSTPEIPEDTPFDP